MNAVDLMNRLQAAGVRIDARGDRLHVEAPAGSITPELRQALADHKAELLALHAIRNRLLALASTMGIPRTVVDALQAVELEATSEQARLCEGHLDGNGDPLAHSLLVFYLRCLADRMPSDRASPAPATHGAAGDGG